MKNEFKIRRLLGNNFHLNIEIKEDGTYVWELFRYYRDKKLYYSEHNKAIMTSDDSTEKDLLKFAKKNREYDYISIANISDFIINCLLCLLAILNIFINNCVIRIIILSIFVNLIINLVIRNIVLKKINDYKWKRLKEELELNLQVLNDEKNNM